MAHARGVMKPDAGPAFHPRRGQPLFGRFFGRARLQHGDGGFHRRHR